MRKFVALVIVCGMVLGCGDSDLNKDLKPIPKDAPMPKAAGASQGAGGTDGMKAKAPAAAIN